MTTTEPLATPPSASGDAGGHFEARVGAYYALALIGGGEARGLPGATILRVGFQQRVAGHPLDDIVVHAQNADGSPATLEIQAKRNMTFTASDREFDDVVSQMWQAFQKPAFNAERYELGVAIAKTTTRIEKDVQEVLRWARAYPDASAFFASIGRRGFANDDMRAFVSTFRTKLTAAGGIADDVSVWSLLRRFKVMPFDFEAPGSDYEFRARDRAASVLPAAQRNRSGDLWNALIVDAEKAASAGGIRDRKTLADDLAAEGGFSFQPGPDLRAFLANLDDRARLASDDIDDQIHGARLARIGIIEQVHAQLAAHPIVNITGAPGVGKSAVLKHLIEEVKLEGIVIVISNGRIVGGGWQQMAHVLGTSLPSATVFGELAAAGGALVFVDNVDQIETPEHQATVRDLLSAVGKYRGWQAVVTTSTDTTDWQQLLPRENARPVGIVTVPEISDDEADDLALQNAALGALLAPGHPAKRVARNLFFLRRLAEIGSPNSVSTELDLARLWWRYGGGRGNDAGRLSRVDALRDMAKSVWQSPGTVGIRMDGLNAPVISELLRLDAVREVRSGAEVTFRHDVMRHWAVGFLLSEQPEWFRDASKSAPLPATVARAVEIAARLALADDPTGAQWRALLEQADSPDVHGSWRRPFLLAIVRSESATQDLKAVKPLLEADDAKLLRELLRLVLVVETMPIGQWLALVQPDVTIPAVQADFVVPTSRSWGPLVQWLVAQGGALPRAAIPEAASIFFSWLLLAQHLKLEINADIVALLLEWLAMLDEGLRPRVFYSEDELPSPLGIPSPKDTAESIRLAAFTFALLNPVAAKAYVAKLNKSKVRFGEFQEILKWRGNLARAAPAEFATFLLREITPDEDEEGSYRRYGPFSIHENLFMPASPANGPFLEVLEADPAAGLALIREIVQIATDWMLQDFTDHQRLAPHINVPFPPGGLSFAGGGGVYGIARSGLPSAMAASALLALEAWGHAQIEGGTPPADVLRDVVGPDGTSSAFLLVATDLALSHWEIMRDVAWPLFASPRLVQLDTERHVHDIAGVHRQFHNQAEPHSARVTRATLDARPSRQMQMQEVFGYYTFHAPEPVRLSLAASLAASAADAQRNKATDEDPLRGTVAVARRLVRMLDPANWRDVEVHLKAGGQATMQQYIYEPSEKKLIDEEQARVMEGAQRSETIAGLHLALNDPSISTPERVRSFVAWAKRERLNAATEDEGGNDPPSFEQQMAHRATVMAAVTVARDYHEGDRPELLSWAEPVLRTEAAAPSKQKVGFENDQVDYNAAAIATVGLIALSGPNIEAGVRAKTLLPLAAASGAAVANALGAAFKNWPDDDPLTRSLLRILIVRSTYSRRASYDEKESVGTARAAKHAETIAIALEAENAWLSGQAPEPAWPILPSWPIRPKHRRRFTRTGIEPVPRAHRDAPDAYVDERRLAKVLAHVFPLIVGRVPAWVVPFTEYLMAWTIDANTDDDDDNPEGQPNTWNGEFLQFVGLLCAALPQDEAIATFVEPFLALPDDAFHDFAAGVLRGFDIGVFSTDSLKPSDVVSLRDTIAKRLKTTSNYKYMGRRKQMSAEWGAGDLLTAMFFEMPGYLPNRGVRFPKDWAGLHTVMPVLTDLVVNAPASGYLATLFLDVLGAAPHPQFVQQAIDALVAWVHAYGPDTGFWVGKDMGARICTWLAECLPGGIASLDEHRRSALTESLDVLVGAGVTSARRVEEVLFGAAA